MTVQEIPYWGKWSALSRSEEWRRHVLERAEWAIRKGRLIAGVTPAGVIMYTKSEGVHEFYVEYLEKLWDRFEGKPRKFETLGLPF